MDRAANQSHFLAAYAQSGQVLQASRWAHVNRWQHATWMREDPTYPERFQEARRRSAQTLEDEAVRRAKDGIKKQLFYQGVPIRIHGDIVYETVYSDRLLERLLEANDPERFRRNIQQTNINEFDWSSLSPAQLEILMDGYLKKMLGTSDPKILESARQLDEGKTIIDIPGVDYDVIEGKTDVPDSKER